MKDAKRHFTRQSVDVTFQDAERRPGQILMRCDDIRHKTYQMTDAAGEEMYTIVRERHTFSPDYFRAYASRSKTILWEMSVNEHTFSSDEISVNILPGTSQARSFAMEKKTLGQDRGLMLNGIPVATTNKASMHLRTEHHINVCAGMDLALVVGVAFCRFVRDAEKNAAAAGGAAGGGGGGCW